MYFKRKITETVKVTSIYGDYSLTTGRTFFECHLSIQAKGVSVTFVNNKAFGCSILYVLFGNSVRDNFRVICLWFDVLPDLSVHVL